MDRAPAAPATSLPSAGGRRGARGPSCLCLLRCPPHPAWARRAAPPRMTGGLLIGTTRTSRPALTDGSPPASASPKAGGGRGAGAPDAPGSSSSTGARGASQLANGSSADALGSRSGARADGTRADRTRADRAASTAGEAGPAPPERAAAARPAERITWVDWVVVALAVVSLGLVITDEVMSSYFQEHPERRRWIIYADLAICGVFFLEFVARMRHQPSKWAYTVSRWYDVLGMIPVSHPLFRGLRLLRILRIVVITSRFVRATNRTFGEMAFEATVRRFRNILVEEVSDAVVLRSLSVVEPWLVRARFADRVGEAMETRRPEIHRMVRDAMGRVPGSKLMLRVGPVRSVVDTAENAAVQAVIDTLRSDELNRIVQEATRNVLDELKAQVAEKEHRKQAV